MSDVRGQIGFGVIRSLGDLALFVEDGLAIHELAVVRTIDFVHGTDDIHAQHVGCPSTGDNLIADGIQCLMSIFVGDFVGQWIGFHIFSQSMQVFFRTEHVEGCALTGTEYHVQQFAHFFEVDAQLDHQVTAARVRLRFLEPLSREEQGVVVLHMHLVPVE